MELPNNKQIEHEYALNEEQKDTLRHNINERNIVYMVTLWVCNANNVVSKSPIMQVMVQVKNVENIDAHEMDIGKSWLSIDKKFYICICML